MLYGLIRMAEPAREHVDNNFSPIDNEVAERFCQVRNEVVSLMTKVTENLRNQRATENDALVSNCHEAKKHIEDFIQNIGVAIQGEDNNLNSFTLVLHMAQELQQLVIELETLLTTLQNFRQQL